MDKPFDDLEGYFSAVGKVTVVLTAIEIYMDFMTAVLYERADGKSFEKEVPRAFNNKVVFCKKCFRNLPVLSELRESAIAIIERASALAGRRNSQIHGMVDNFTPVSPGVIIMRKIEYQKHHHNTVEWTTSIEEIEGMAKSGLILDRAFTLLVNELRKKFGIDP